MAAVGAALAVDEAVVAQLGEDVLEEGQGDRLAVEIASPFSGASSLAPAASAIAARTA